MARRRRLRTVDVVAAYVASRRARGCSEKYVDWLGYTLGHLVRAHAVLPDGPEPLEAVLAGLTVGDETRRDVWSSFRQMYRWAAGRLGVTNAMAVVERPLVRRKEVRTLSQLEVDQLLFANQRRRRDYALLLLLLDTGARVGEVATLGWRDVRPSSVRLTGKTGGREVPISATTTRALYDLGGELWIGRRGGRLTVGGVQKAVQRCLRRAGLRGGPHLLRHTFGRLYIMAGGDVFSLQRILGHRQISTTRRYVDLDLRDVTAQHALFSPVARRAAGEQLPLLVEVARG